MNKFIKILLLSILLFSCQRNIQNENKTIYTSFYPIYFLTKSLLEENIEVKNLVPYWVEPHDFEPTLKQISDMQKSYLIILNWLWMEVYEDKLINKFWSWKVILLSENLDNLIKIEKNNSDIHNHSNINPHTWVSPKMYLKMAEVLSKELENKWYKINKNIIIELQRLSNLYENNLKNCNSKEIIVSHNAYEYLSRDFSFKAIPILWISKENEPSAKELANIINIIKNEKIKYIFTDELISTKITNIIKNETNTEILTLEPVENLNNDEVNKKENYITIMTKNLEKLKLWLDCK